MRRFPLLFLAGGYVITPVCCKTNITKPGDFREFQPFSCHFHGSLFAGMIFGRVANRLLHLTGKHYAVAGTGRGVRLL